MVVTRSHHGYIKRTRARSTRRKTGLGMPARPGTKATSCRPCSPRRRTITCYIARQGSRVHYRRCVPRHENAHREDGYVVNVLELQEGEQGVDRDAAVQFAPGTSVFFNEAATNWYGEETDCRLVENVRQSQHRAIHDRRRRSASSTGARDQTDDDAADVGEGSPCFTCARPACSRWGERRRRSQHLAARRPNKLVGMYTFARDSAATMITVRARLRQAHDAVGLPDEESRQQRRHHDQDHRAQDRRMPTMRIVTDDDHADPDPAATAS